MVGFNHQNVIFALNITSLLTTESDPHFAVEIDPSFGVEAEFTCSAIEVVEAVPCTESGEPV
jgi:hypothetical protein